jgi:serine/threonine protein kinase
MRSCVTKIAKTFSPRYVHVYDTEGDTPYDIDTSISPCAGSYGVVQKVKQKVTKETFARKTYRNVFSSKERKAVLNELGVLEICFHPNIVTLVEAYEVTHEPYTINLVMSPWAPITLEDFLYTAGPKRKELFAWFEPNKTSSDKRIYNIMLGLAKAVHYLHGLSIKHKDIKPDNILLHVEKDQVVPYLTDVGVSKVYYRGAKTNYDQSTYTFLSPEQLEHRESSLKADIWQLGCCFAMLLALVRGGQQGVLKLHVSYRRTDERCSCNIALELDWFMGALKELCASGTAEQQHIQWMIGQMLDVNSLTRFDIERVIKELTKALEI